MPANPRVRDNNVFGTISDNPLTAGATTFNSTRLPLLQEVSSEHAMVTLDPLRQFGDPEIVVVTAHGSGATSATITRGAYGTSDRTHPGGTTWVHAVTDQDLIEIVGATGDITDPYEGQLVYEHDTNIYHGYDGSGWVEGLPLSAWQTYTPVWTQSTTVTQTTTYATYTRMGRLVTVNVHLLASGGGTASNSHLVTLPIAPTNSSIESGRRIVGVGSFKDASANQFYPLHALLSGGGAATVIFESSDIIVGVGAQFFGLHGNTAAAAVNDQIQFTVTYEAAA